VSTGCQMFKCNFPMFFLLKVQQQKRGIRLLRTKLSRKPDVRKLVLLELLKSHSRATVHFMMGNQLIRGRWSEK
jgi:hypothetical protein